ncbi:hypothetical protein D3C71_1219720 [compost metagenome]
MTLSSPSKVSLNTESKQSLAEASKQIASLSQSCLNEAVRLDNELFGVELRDGTRLSNPDSSIRDNYYSTLETLEILYKTLIDLNYKTNN